MQNRKRGTYQLKVSDNPNKFAGHDKRKHQQRQVEQDESNALIRQIAEQNAEQQKQIMELMNKLLEKN